MHKTNEDHEMQFSGGDPVISIAGVDAEKGLSLYYDEMDIYLQALSSYVHNTPAVLDKIRSVSAETLENYSIIIHGIKSISANIGAEKIKDTAKELEDMSKAGNLEGVIAKNNAFIQDTEIVIAEIKKWLDQYAVTL